MDVARFLLDQGAFIDVVTPTMGHTPVMDAFWYKRKGIVELLVERGANLQLGAYYGFTLDDHIQFQLNVNQGEEKLKIQELVRIIEGGRERIRQEIERQKVMAATRADDLDAVKAAIDQGASVNAVSPRVNSFFDGHTPLVVVAGEAGIRYDAMDAQMACDGACYVDADLVTDGDLITARTGGHCHLLARAIIDRLQHPDSKESERS